MVFCSDRKNNFALKSAWNKHNYVGEGKNKLDAISTHVYSQLVNSQHVSGIIMPIVRRTDCIKLRVVFVWLCWLRSCGAGTRDVRWVRTARLPVCVGCGRVELGHELYAECVQLGCLFACLCWLRSCGAGTRALRWVRTARLSVCLVVLAAVVWSWDTSCTLY